MKNINQLALQNCKNINLIFNISNIKRLIISECCEEIDVNILKKFDLEMLKIENVKVINLKNIENFANIEILYLQEIDLDEKIDYYRFPKLKVLNLDGSTSKNMDEYIKQLKELNIQFSYKKNNLKID